MYRPAFAGLSGPAPIHTTSAITMARTGDPRPPGSATPTRMARTLSLKSGGWFLALRGHQELGPYPTAKSAMNASRELDARLCAMDAPSAERIIQSFADEQRRLLSSLKAL